MTIYCNTYQENEMAVERVHSLLTPTVKGIIYSPVLGSGAQIINREIMTEIDKKNIPVVLVDRFLEERLDCHVVINNRESFYNLADLLIKNGHKKILYIDGFKATSSNDRLEGVQAAFRDLGGNDAHVFVVTLNETELYRSGRVPEDIIRQVSEMGDFTALVGLNQLLLDAGKDIVKKLGMQVETAMAVAASHEKVSDYAVVLPVYKMGREAAELLIKQIEDESRPVTQVILKAALQDNRPEDS